MAESRVFRMALERQLSRRRSVRERRWRELCKRRGQEVQEEPSSRKSHEGLRTISEVADKLQVKKYVLRFWERRFRMLSAMKRGGGSRCYRPEHVELLRAIRDLLYVHGYTIKGVEKLLCEEGFGLGQRPLSRWQWSTPSN